jgi:hypothetical protein
MSYHPPLLKPFCRMPITGSIPPCSPQEYHAFLSPPHFISVVFPQVLHTLRRSDAPRFCSDIHMLTALTENSSIMPPTVTGLPGFKQPDTAGFSYFVKQLVGKGVYWRTSSTMDLPICFDALNTALISADGGCMIISSTMSIALFASSS